VSDNTVPPEANPLPPEPGPLDGLIDRVKATGDVKLFYSEEVIRAAYALRKTDPGRYAELTRDLKAFKHENPRSGFTFEVFNFHLKKLAQVESALMIGEPDASTLLVQLSLRARQHFMEASTENIYADIEVDVDGAVYPATVAVQGRTYGRWLGMHFYSEYGRAAPVEAFKSALRTIEARTYSERVSFHLFQRIAQVEDTNGDPVIYLDRGTLTGEAFRIDHDGIEVIENPPVKFIRPEGGIGVLPVPVDGGNINDMEKMLNLRGRRDFVLGIGWVLGCYQPRYALLVALLLGRHGSAKTSALRRFCALIDPLIDEPDEPVREDREVIVVAQDSYVQSSDNVVNISPTRSAALCRMSTGGSQRGRRFYTNTETYRIRARRPVIMTAIRMVVTAPDLIDRTAIIGMGAPFEEDNEGNREEERVLEQAFAKAWPALFGCVLRAVVEGLQHLRAAKAVPKPLPRMADFAAWTYRCEAGLGWRRGTILRAYRDALLDYSKDIAELDSVAAGLLAFMLDHPGGWRGSIAMLGAYLSKQDGGRATRGRGWSWDLKDLSASIDDLASVLFRNGLKVTRGHSDGKREVILSWLPHSRSNGVGDNPAPPPHAAPAGRDGTSTWRPKP
jgi:hypothetical protein